MLGRLTRASVRTQIVLLATLPLLILSIVLPTFPPFADSSREREYQASFMIGKLVLIAEQVRLAKTPEEKSAVLGASIQAGGFLAIIPGSASDVIDVGGLTAAEMRQTLAARLSEIAHRWETSVTPVVMQIDSQHSLAFQPPVGPALPAFAWGAALDLLRVAAIVVPMFLLAWYLSWRITFPLIHFAAAARRISLEDEQEQPFLAEGPAEVVSLAASLNAMRARIRQMVEHRTLVLRAVSHDLRTPLTRLRMRAERCEAPELRRQMLVDIVALTGLIDDSMAYITDKSIKESLRRIDMASLLQTVVSDYSDMGLAISFSGPRRLAHNCRPRGIARVVGNLIDNAARYATHIEVSLRAEDDGHAVIEVSDDGPGLPEDLKRRAIEPFFKADPARTSQEGSGLGLGLAIADGIVKTHGGSLRLLDRQPHGLVVQISLPPNL